MDGRGFFLPFFFCLFFFFFLFQETEHDLFLFLFFSLKLLIHLKLGSWIPKGVRSTPSWVWKRRPLYKYPCSGSGVGPEPPHTHMVKGSLWKHGRLPTRDIPAPPVLSTAFSPARSPLKHRDSEVSASDANPEPSPRHPGKPCVPQFSHLSSGENMGTTPWGSC